MTVSESRIHAVCQSKRSNRETAGDVAPCDLTVLILTYNEKLHIERCLASIVGLASRVVVVDSFSTDGTRELAASSGAEVVTHSWTNHTAQFNWALDNLGIDTAWTMRLDADELAMPDLAASLRRVLPKSDSSVAGYTLNLRRYFFGKWLRHGALYPIRLLRVWRTGRGRCENRLMDEHVVVEGAVEHIDADFADWTLHDITRWTAKHNDYATKEAYELLTLEAPTNRTFIEPVNQSWHARVKRRIKGTVYVRLPLGLRAIAYFIYRYFVRLGFLDGWPGFVFHFLQGLWYRFLVDVKVYELKQKLRTDRRSLAEIVHADYGIQVEPNGPPAGPIVGAPR